MPWPISGPLQMMVITPSGAMRMKEFGTNSFAAAAASADFGAQAKAITSPAPAAAESLKKPRREKSCAFFGVNVSNSAITAAK